MLDETRKPLFPNCKQNFEKKFGFFWEIPHSAEKCYRDTLGFIDIHPVAKYLKKLNGDPLMLSKNFRKNLSAEKIYVKKTKIAKGDPQYVFEFLDVGFILDEVLTYPVCFGYAYSTLNKKVDLSV